MSIDEISAEMVRMRGFIRAAETQASKVVALVDALPAAPEPPAEPTEPPPVEDPEPEPEPEPSEPPPSDPGFPNMPAGYSVIFDDTFAYDWSESMGTPPGWSDIGQGAMAGMSKTLDDSSSPTGRALESIYPPHLDGGGPLRINKRFGTSYDRLYVSWWAKWEDGFDHNGTSEKHLYFNHPGTGYLLFEQHWRGEALFGVLPDVKYYDRDSALRANQEPNGVDRQGLPVSPIVDGIWRQYEFVFDRSTGTVKWWVNGVLHASYTGRSFPALANVVLSSVWGGSGDKVGSHYRRTARFTVAVG